MTRISGELDPEAADLLRTALDPLSGPRPAEDGTPDPRSPARRRADGLVDLLHRTLTGGELPTNGGIRPHLTVTVPLSTLLGTGTIPATTGWGLPLPASVLRRLSCDASVTRVVLSGDSVPLDIGRSTRIVPPPLRRALIARDVCCAFPGCDRPASWCEAHHIRAWVNGGVTSLDNLTLPLRHHRARVRSAAGPGVGPASGGDPSSVGPSAGEPAPAAGRHDPLPLIV
jgi:hypothetical protein